MKKILPFGLALGLLLGSSGLNSQDRYKDEIFTDAQIEKIDNVNFGVNINFLTSDLSASQVTIGTDLTALKTAVATGMPIDAKYYDPTDNSTALKVQNMEMDIYMPKLSEDNITDRPVIVYIHTGNFLPPIINGGATGANTDSAAVELCKQWAKRGYVAVAPNYRHGWNPVSTSAAVRRGTLLNAVYRAIHDVKQAVRTIKQDANGANTYGIDPNKVVLYGQGSGGYVALAYGTLDKPGEISIPKFIDPTSGNSYVDTNVVGNYEGFAPSQTALTLYLDNFTVNSDVSMTVNAGGALADESWLEAGDPAMVTIHAVRDPFAPFDAGTVIVPTTNEDVVDVHGPNVFIPKANSLGNNDKINGTKVPNFGNPVTALARTRYGVQYATFAPINNVTVDADAEGLYAFLRPLGASQFQNNSSPWEWYNFSDLQANVTAINAATGGSYDANTVDAGMQVSNPDVHDKSKALAFIDTIQQYIHPRIMLELEIGDYISISTEDLEVKTAGMKFYPVPTNDQITVDAGANDRLQSVSITDITGRVVYSNTNLSDNREVIDVSRYPSGLYLVKAKSNRQEEVRKIVVE